MRERRIVWLSSVIDSYVALHAVNRRGACQAAEYSLERDEEKIATQQQTTFTNVIDSVPEAHYKFH